MPEPLPPPMIHPTAIIDAKAELDPSVEVGPYSIIEADVTIGAGTQIGPHVIIQGITEIGRDNKIGSFATIGHAPQHLRYKGEPRRLKIGDRNDIREYSSMHRAYLEGEGTIVGNDGLYMAYSHVAHDCIVGDNVVLVGLGGLGGHCIVEDYAFVSGLTMVHQFCRVGTHTFLGPNTKIDRDVPPFMLAEGNPVGLRGINLNPLAGRGFTPEAIKALQGFYRKVYRGEGTFRGRLEQFVEQETKTPEIQLILDFYASENTLGDDKRGLMAAPLRAKRR